MDVVLQDVMDSDRRNLIQIRKLRIRSISRHASNARNIYKLLERRKYSQRQKNFGRHQRGSKPMAFRKLLRKPASRVLLPRTLQDVRSSKSLLERPADVETLSAVELADFLTTYDDRVYKLDGYSNLPSPQDYSLQGSVIRAIELLPDMDSQLIVRIISRLSRTNEVSKTDLHDLLSATVPRIGDFSLGCLSRFLFSLSTSGSVDEVTWRKVLDAAEPRVIFLLSSHERIPPRVLSKLFVSFSAHEGLAIDSTILKSLERLLPPVVPTLDPSQLQQISFALSRVDHYSNPELVEQLLDRAIDLSPVNNMNTYTALHVSMHKLGKEYEKFRIFSKSFRDFVALGSGYVSRTRLHRSLLDRGFMLGEQSPRFQAILNSLKLSHSPS